MQIPEYMCTRDIMDFLHLRANEPSIKDEHAKGLFKWENEQKQLVAMGSYKDIPESMSAHVEQASERMKIGHCYENAYYASCPGQPAIDYVEGYINVGGIIMCAHAWNACGDIHFDPTREILMKNGGILEVEDKGGVQSLPNTYVQIVRVSPAELYRNLATRRRHGYERLEQYARTVLGKTKATEVKKFIDNHMWLCAD